MVNRKKRNKKILYWIVILALLIAAGVVGYFVWDNYFNNRNEETQVVDTNEQGEQAEENDTAETADNTEVDDKKVKQYEGEDPNNSSELSGVVTYASLVDNKLMIRVNIDQFLDSGSCSLSLVKNGAEVYTETTKIINSASTSTCEGFDITGIGAGLYNIVINLVSGEKTGVINGEVDI